MAFAASPEFDPPEDWQRQLPPSVGRVTAAEILPDHPDYEVVIREVATGRASHGNQLDDSWFLGFGRTLAEWRSEHPDLVVPLMDTTVSLQLWADRDPDTTVIRVEGHLVPKWLYEKRRKRGEDPFAGDTPHYRSRERLPSRTPIVEPGTPWSWVDVEITCATPHDRAALAARLRKHDYKGSAEVTEIDGELVLRIRTHGTDIYRAQCIVESDCGQLGLDPSQVHLRARR